MSTTEGHPQPIVCTLVDKALAERTLEWTDLADLRLSSERIDSGVASTYPVERAAQIEELANREAQCCGSWLSSNITQLQDTVRLELTTQNPDGIDLIIAMSGLASDS